MESVWAGRPAKNPKGWLNFKRIRSFVIALSWVEVVMKLLAVVLVGFIYHGAKQGKTAQQKMNSAQNAQLQMPGPPQQQYPPQTFAPQ